jgi:tetratricopeptide (TPR) repeat protein
MAKRLEKLFIQCYHSRLAEEKKNAGNEEYKIKNYAAALKHYTEAINLSPEHAAYYGNRAATHLMLNDFAAALSKYKNLTSL